MPKAKRPKGSNPDALQPLRDVAAINDAKPTTNGQANGQAAKAAPNGGNGVSWRWRSTDRTYGVLHIVKDGEGETYFARTILRNTDTVLTLEKLTPGAEVTYTVVLATNYSCGCPGFVHHGHCKHLDALHALAQAGRL